MFSTPPEYQVPIIPIQPLSFSEILGETRRIYGRHWVTFFTIALMMALPALVLTIILNNSQVHTLAYAQIERMMDFIGALPQNPTTQQMEELQNKLQTLDIDALTRYGLLYLGIVLVNFFIFRSLAIGATTIIVAESYAGKNPTLSTGLSAFRRFGTLVSWGLLLGLMRGLLIGTLFFLLAPLSAIFGGLGFLIVFAAVVTAPLVLIVRLLFGARAIVAEDLGVAAAWRRSWQLSRGHFWRILGISLGMLALAVLVYLLSNGIFGAIFSGSADAVSSDGQLVIAVVFDTVVTALFAPVVYISLSLLYYDQRRQFERLGK